MLFFEFVESFMMAITTRWWDNLFDVSKRSAGRATKHAALLRKIKWVCVQGEKRASLRSGFLCAGRCLGRVGVRWGGTSRATGNPEVQVLGLYQACVFESPNWLLLNRFSTEDNSFFCCVSHCHSFHLEMWREYLLMLGSFACKGDIRCRSPLSH